MNPYSAKSTVDGSDLRSLIVVGVEQPNWQFVGSNPGFGRRHMYGFSVWKRGSSSM